MNALNDVIAHQIKKPNALVYGTAPSQSIPPITICKAGAQLPAMAAESAPPSAGHRPRSPAGGAGRRGMDGGRSTPASSAATPPSAPRTTPSKVSPVLLVPPLPSCVRAHGAASTASALRARRYQLAVLNRTRVRLRKVHLTHTSQLLEAAWFC